MASIPAELYPFELDRSRAAVLVIDMQQDFMEAGGFGAALGNDVSLLRCAISPIGAVLSAARASGVLVVYTREGHRPDLTDLPPRKLRRG